MTNDGRKQEVRQKKWKGKETKNKERGEREVVVEKEDRENW